MHLGSLLLKCKLLCDTHIVIIKICTGNVLFLCKPKVRLHILGAGVGGSIPSASWIRNSLGKKVRSFVRKKSQIIC